MRTALVLLFALALAAIPGSLVPQRTVSPVRVASSSPQHPTLGPIYDRVGLFGVYTSPWFSAIYLLLFISLVGCIIPRVGSTAALRARHRRPRATWPGCPRTRPPNSRPTSSDEDRVLDRAAEMLRAQRYRVDPARRLAWPPNAATCARPATGLPRQPAVPAGRCRDRWLCGLPRDQRGDRRAGLRQQPDPVRRLLRRRPVLRRRPAPVQRGRREVRREVRDRAGAARRGAAVQGRRRGHRSARGAARMRRCSRSTSR